MTLDAGRICPATRLLWLNNRGAPPPPAGLDPPHNGSKEMERADSPRGWRSLRWWEQGLLVAAVVLPVTLFLLGSIEGSAAAMLGIGLGLLAILSEDARAVFERRRAGIWAKVMLIISALAVVALGFWIATVL